MAKCLTQAYENGTRTVYDYDSTYGRLTAVTHYSATGAVMLGVDYTYDEDSLVTGCTRTLGDRVTGIAYGYDAQQRLAREIWTEDSTQVYGVEYTYDDVGNRYTWGVYDPVSEATVVHSATYAYTASPGIQAASAPNLMVGHEIANATAWTYTWDKNGNLKGAVAEIDGTDRERRLYGWDTDNRLVEVEVQGSANGTTWSMTRTVAFVYCPSCGGKRTQKLVWDGERDSTPDAWYRYEGEGLNELRVDERYDSQSDGNAVIDADDPWRTIRYTIHGPGQISHEIKEVQFDYFGAGSEPTSTRTIYYHFDRLGNVLGISDEDGALLQSYTCDAFGVDLDGWDDTYTTRRMTGKAWDADVDLYCFDARYQSPSLGIFVSADPFPLRAPASSEYLVAADSPTLAIDPTGLKTCIYIGQQRVPWTPGRLATHPIYVEEVHGAARTRYWSTELADNHIIGFRYPDKGDGPFPTEARPPFRNTRVHALTDISRFCSNKRCLQQGLDKDAFVAWTNLKYVTWEEIRPVQRPDGRWEWKPGPVYHRWGNRYDFFAHNCNHYLNEVLRVCGCGGVEISADGGEITTP